MSGLTVPAAVRERREAPLPNGKIKLYEVIQPEPVMTMVELEKLALDEPNLTLPGLVERLRAELNPLPPVPPHDACAKGHVPGVNPSQCVRCAKPIPKGTR